jgi:hypothetical protein
MSCHTRVIRVLETLMPQEIRVAKVKAISVGLNVSAYLKGGGVKCMSKLYFSIKQQNLKTVVSVTLKYF